MAGPMARILGPLEERVGHLEGAVRAMQAQIDKLTQCALGQFDGHMQAFQRQLAVKADVAHCDALQGALGRLEQQVGGLQQALAAEPRARQGGGEGCGEPGDSGSDDVSEPCETSEPVPNVLLNLVVAYSRAGTEAEGGAAKLGSVGDVTVEARCLERVGAVKKRAYEQLSVWHRFCDVGNDVDELVFAALEHCQLVVRGGGARGEPKPLKDRRRVADCGLQDGAELLLVPRRAGRPGSEQHAAAAGSPPDVPRELVNLTVTHNTGQVDVEAINLDTVKSVKQRAHEQLTMWYRFCDLGEDEGTESSLPLLEQCRLYTAGKGDGVVPPRPLKDEGRRLAECGIVDGDQLELRST